MSDTICSLQSEGTAASGTTSKASGAVVALLVVVSLVSRGKSIRRSLGYHEARTDPSQQETARSLHTTFSVPRIWFSAFKSLKPRWEYTSDDRVFPYLMQGLRFDPPNICIHPHALHNASQDNQSVCFELGCKACVVLSRAVYLRVSPWKVRELSSLGNKYVRPSNNARERAFWRSKAPSFRPWNSLARQDRHISSKAHGAAETALSEFTDRRKENEDMA